MVLICKKVWREMYIKKSQDWRRKLITPQYNVKLRLIIRAQCNLHEGNPLRIDGNPGGSSLTFRIWNIHNFYVAKGTLIQNIYKWKALIKENPMRVIALDLVWL